MTDNPETERTVELSEVRKSIDSLDVSPPVPAAELIANGQFTAPANDTTTTQTSLGSQVADYDG